ncbi:unnamed protein product [Arabidopsis halleri]
MSYIRSGDLKWHFFCPFSLQLGVDSSNADNTKMLSLLVVDCKVAVEMAKQKLVDATVLLHSSRVIKRLKKSESHQSCRKRW